MTVSFFEQVRTWVVRKPSFGRQEQALVFRQLALMLGCGVPVIRAVRLIGSGERNPDLRSTFSEVELRMRRGLPLSEALNVEHRLFPPAVLELLRAGEASGHLVAALSDTATHLEKQAKFHVRVRSTMTYPLFTMALCLLMVFVLPAFLLPSMFAMLRDLHAELPISTRALMLLSHVVRWPLTYPITAGCLLAAVHRVRQMWQIPTYRLAWERRILRLPGCGACLLEIATTEFAQTLALMLSSGLPLQTSLRASGATTGSLALEHAVADASRRIQDGSTLRSALEASAFFNGTFCHLVATGEESGSLPQALTRYVAISQHTLDARIGRMIVMLEPLTMLLMGAAVGFVALSTMKPLISVLQKLAQ